MITCMGLLGVLFSVFFVRYIDRRIIMLVGTMACGICQLVQAITWSVSPGSAEAGNVVVAFIALFTFFYVAYGQSSIPLLFPFESRHGWLTIRPRQLLMPGFSAASIPTPQSEGRSNPEKDILSDLSNSRASTVSMAFGKAVSWETFPGILLIARSPRLLSISLHQSLHSDPQQLRLRARDRAQLPRQLARHLYGAILHQSGRAGLVGPLRLHLVRKQHDPVHLHVVLHPGDER